MDLAGSWSESERALQRKSNSYRFNLVAELVGADGSGLERLKQEANLKGLWVLAESLQQKDRGAPPASGRQLHFVGRVLDEVNVRLFRELLERALEDTHTKITDRIEKRRRKAEAAAAAGGTTKADPVGAAAAPAGGAPAAPGGAPAAEAAAAPPREAGATNGQAGGWHPGGPGAPPAHGWPGPPPYWAAGWRPPPGGGPPEMGPGGAGFEGYPPHFPGPGGSQAAPGSYPPPPGASGPWSRPPMSATHGGQATVFEQMQPPTRRMEDASTTGHQDGERRSRSRRRRHRGSGEGDKDRKHRSGSRKGRRRRRGRSGSGGGSGGGRGASQ